MQITAIMNQAGKYLMILSGLIFVAGLLWYLSGDKLHWIGRLPGDIRVEKQHFKFYFPITTMILFSVILSLLVYFVRKLF